MKVVINVCYGGFGLSDEGFEKFLDKKGIAWEKMQDKYGNWNHYNHGHLDNDEHLLFDRGLTEYDRSDPALVAVVEEMGELSYGTYAKLKIVEIPDDIEWTVMDYDGMEWVAEAHRTWS